MNNSVFGKTMENVRKHRHQTCNNRKKKKLFSFRTNLSSKKVFTENLLIIEMRKPQLFMNILVQLGLSILKLSKIVMYDLWYDYVITKYGERAIILLGYRELHCLHKNG